MAVVLEQQIEHTQVRIHDDSCRDAAPEQVREILRRIALRAKAALSAAAEEEA